MFKKEMTDIFKDSLSISFSDDIECPICDRNTLSQTPDGRFNCHSCRWQGFLQDENKERLESNLKLLIQRIEKTVEIGTHQGWMPEAKAIKLLDLAVRIKEMIV